MSFKLAPGCGCCGCSCPDTIDIEVPTISNSGCNDCHLIAGTYTLSQSNYQSVSDEGQSQGCALYGVAGNSCKWAAHISEPTGCGGGTDLFIYMGYDVQIFPDMSFPDTEELVVNMVWGTRTANDLIQWSAKQTLPATSFLDSNCSQNKLLPVTVNEGFGDFGFFGAQCGGGVEGDIEVNP